MKKIITCLCFFVLTVIGFAAEEKVEAVKKENYTVNVSVGVVPFSDYSVQGSTVDGDGAPFEFSIEAMKEVKPNWFAGLGFGVHNLADGETRLSGRTLATFEDYKSYPIYLTTKYSFPVVGDGVRPYVKADLGYAFNGRVKYEVIDGSGKVGVDHGMYAGAGFGIEQNNINVGLMFKTTHGEIKGHDYDNYRVVLTAGYDFDFSL